VSRGGHRHASRARAGHHSTSRRPFQCTARATVLPPTRAKQAKGRRTFFALFFYRTPVIRRTGIFTARCLWLLPKRGENRAFGQRLQSSRAEPAVKSQQTIFALWAGQTLHGVSGQTVCSEATAVAEKVPQNFLTRAIL